MHYLKSKREFVEWPVKNCCKIVERDLNMAKVFFSENDFEDKNRHQRDFHFRKKIYSNLTLRKKN